MQKTDGEDLVRVAAELRHVVTDIIGRAGAGHLGGALSLVEILVSLYWRVMRFDPKNPQWEDRDRLVLSKGHGGPTLYAILSRLGFFPAEELTTLNQNGTHLPSHCDMQKTPGIDMTTGSLGQGLSAAAGIALGARLDRKDYRIFCVLGDGELDEGQNWEAAMFAAHHKLDRIVAITDRNKFQIDGLTQDILDIEPLADKWRAFNWRVLEADGHSFDSLVPVLQEACQPQGRPTMVIAHTLKGKGHPVYENQAKSHHIHLHGDEAYRELVDAVRVEGFRYPYE